MPLDANDRLVMLARLPWWTVRLVQYGVRGAAWAQHAFNAVGQAITGEVRRSFPPAVADDTTRKLATHEYLGAPARRGSWPNGPSRPNRRAVSIFAG